MKELAIETVRGDVLKRFQEYVNIFPQMLGFFDAYRKKPECEGCVDRMLLELSRQPNLEEKLKELYGEEVKVDKELITYKERVAPTIASAKTDVFYVVKDDYKKFIDDFCKDKIIRVIDTVYIPEDKEIIVTMVYNVILKQK